jgi:hypothetical protein
VARELNVRIIETICIASYMNYKNQGEIQVMKGIGHEVTSMRAAGKGVLIVDDLVDASLVELQRNIHPGTGNRGGADGDPATLGNGLGDSGGKRKAAVVGTLATRMGQLNSGGGTDGMHEVDDALPLVALGVVPDAGALRGNARLGAHARCFGHKHAHTTGRHRSGVDEVPIVGHAIVIEAHVLAHR